MLWLLSDPGLVCRLDGKHVVFGEVQAGMEVVREVEALGNSEGTPAKEVVVVGCGALPADA